MDKLKMLLASLAVIALTGCIKNDIPYPRILAGFTSFAVVGETKPADIDDETRTITVYLPEDANIYEVKVCHYELTSDTEVITGDLSAPLDLSAKCYFDLRMYQDYMWTIVAEQKIEREFAVEGQIGVSVIDVPGRRVVATINDRTPLESVTVTACKLGPSCAKQSPELAGKKVDFTEPVVVSVENYGHYEQWTIYMQQTEATVMTTRADGWTNVAWVYGEAQAGKANTIQYRIKGDTEWLTVPDAWVTRDGGDFYARITGLSPQTTYEARAVSGSEYGEALEFTTGIVEQVPNSNFDEWWLNGKVWNPWPEGGPQYWDTGNKGATTLGPSNSTPTDDTVTGTGRAAKLETKFVGIGSLGKLAAGNIFIGSYVRTDGTNGILSFGRQFHQRPTRLKGYCKYQTAPISSATAGFEQMKGRPDTCTVWIALIDTDEPFEIRTNPKNQNLFDPNGSYVVAYGAFQSGDDIPAYAPFDIELKYTSTSRVPKYIIITGSASKYGDYFTGGNGAVLYLDDLELLYDY